MGHEMKILKAILSVGIFLNLLLVSSGRSAFPSDNLLLSTKKNAASVKEAEDLVKENKNAILERLIALKASLNVRLSQKSAQGEIYAKCSFDRIDLLFEFLKIQEKNDLLEKPPIPGEPPYYLVTIPSVVKASVYQLVDGEVFFEVDKKSSTVKKVDDMGNISFKQEVEEVRAPSTLMVLFVTRQGEIYF